MKRMEFAIVVSSLNTRGREEKLIILTESEKDLQEHILRVYHNLVSYLPFWKRWIPKRRERLFSLAMAQAIEEFKAQTIKM